MVAAIVVLFVVVFFIVTLHVYAKWFWRRSATRRNTASWRRRHRLDFAGADPSGLNHTSIGLDKSVIDSLPTFSYKLPPSEEEPLLECAVCLCEFEEAEKGRLLPSCKHSFHTGCIDMWFQSHTTCPLCRTVVTTMETPSKTDEVSTADQGSSSPLPLLRNGSDSNDGTSSPYPNNVLFWGDLNHVSSQLSSPGIESGGSSSTRSLPQISTEIPQRLESFTAPRCMSLSLSRCPSVDIDQECSSQPLKSPSIRMSIKRLLSSERSRARSRVSPSVDYERGEEETVPTNVQAV